MKFTNGFWLVKEEYTPRYVRDIYEVEEESREVKMYAPYKKIEGRGDTLNTGMMTYTVTAPAPDVLGIRMQNHAGNYVTEPYFRLDKGEEIRPLVSRIENRYEIRSGKLSLLFQTGNPEMTFEAEGRELTCIKPKTTAMMRHREGKEYLVTGLNLGVGELDRKSVV